jgi:hypothetical protein
MKKQSVKPLWLATLAAASMALPAMTAHRAPAAGGSPEATASEDLGAELFDDAVESTASDPSANAAASPADRPEFAAASQMLDPLRQLMGAGQGSPAPDDWLRVVTLSMRAAQDTLALQDATGRASAAQRDAVNELDALLVKMQKQCDKCCSQCNKPGTANKPPKPGKAGAKPGATTAQATARATKADRTAVGRLVNDLWGRLPQRQRDELLQPLSEEFVPEYAAETEDYFRALAEPASYASPDAPRESRP